MLTWVKAYWNCKARGGKGAHLVSLTSEEEMDNIMFVAANNTVWTSGRRIITGWLRSRILMTGKCFIVLTIHSCYTRLIVHVQQLLFLHNYDYTHDTGLHKMVCAWQLSTGCTHV